MKTAQLPETLAELAIQWTIAGGIIGTICAFNYEC